LRKLAKMSTINNERELEKLSEARWRYGNNNIWRPHPPQNSKVEGLVHVTCSVGNNVLGSGIIPRHV
jgi:hypothetical protein